MDGSMLGLIIALIKGVPESAGAKAIQAKEDAEAAAQLAQQYGYKFTVEGKTLVIGEEESDG